MNVLLEAQNLTKAYEKKEASLPVLRGVTFQCSKGEQIAIVGASGAGKSTLLHLLGGLDRPSSGTVLFEGENLFEKNEKELAQFRNQKLGFVFQFHHLLPLFTALENVMMPCLIAGENKAEACEKAFDLLNEVGLGTRLHHFPSELSGGEQQRVALARALVRRPEILMADEPTGNLDGETSRKVFDELLKLNQTFHTTLIVVTHNEELARLLKRRVILCDGQIRE